MAIAKKIASLIVGFFTIYSTPKVVQVQNQKIAVINRIIQLLIFAYVLGFMIIYKKGYQLSSSIESAVITKIKGTTRINITTDHPLYNPKFPENKLSLYNRLWDGQDIVYPPKESNGFFLTSNLVITKDQTLGFCPDYDTKCDVNKAPKECTDKQSVLSDGRYTGKCLTSEKPGDGVCQIEGWCPLEDETLPLVNKTPIFSEIENFTVLIKNTIRFPVFNILRRNIDEKKQTDKELKSCTFSPETPRCPIFKIGDIIKYANVDFKEIASSGGVIAIQINWNCNLDWDLSYCFPTYTFTRLDLAKALVSPGYNFRYSRYNNFDNKEKRDLFKAYGIRFEILTSGIGSKFSVVPLALNIGSGVGLLALATLVCDMIMLYFTPAKDLYNKKKYLYVGSTDELSKVTSQTKRTESSTESQN